MMRENILNSPRIAQPRKTKAQIALLLPCFQPDIEMFFFHVIPELLSPRSSSFPTSCTPALPRFPSLLCLFPFPAWRRGPVGGKHERSVFGGGGEIVAGERSEHGPGRLLETQRLLTSLEGTHK